MSLSVKVFYGIRFANTYLITSGNESAIVDPGELPDEIVNSEVKIKYILLTHDHFDHIASVKEIKDIYPDAEIIIHKNDADGLFDQSHNLSKMMGMTIPPTKADIIVSDGDTIKLGDTDIKVIHTPGHTDGSVCYFADDVIFSGDTLFFRSIGRTDFPSGNYKDMTESLKKLMQLDGGIKVYPGHGEITSIEFERKNNPYF